MIGWVRWVAAAGAMAVASPAFALVTGVCLPAQQVRTALAAEKMQPIIVGNRTGYGYPTSLIFFADADGSRGYLIRGDKPLGQQSDTACVDSVYRDIRLNDVARTGIPDWARIPVRPSEVDAICRRHLGYQDQCRRYDESLANMEGNGLHVMLMATGTAINPRDHTIRADQRILVTLDAKERGGLIKAATPEGASYMLSAYTGVSYTQNGSATFAERVDIVDVAHDLPCTHRERRRIALPEIPFALQATMHVRHSGFDILAKLELAPALRDFDGPDLTRPVVDILKQVPMDSL